MVGTSGVVGTSGLSGVVGVSGVVGTFGIGVTGWCGFKLYPPIKSQSTGFPHSPGRAALFGASFSSTPIISGFSLLSSQIQSPWLVILAKTVVVLSGLICNKKLGAQVACIPFPATSPRLVMYEVIKS